MDSMEKTEKLIKKELEAHEKFKKLPELEQAKILLEQALNQNKTNQYKIKTALKIVSDRLNSDECNEFFND